MFPSGNKRSFTCIVFPGQGSQRSGMGLDFLERFAEAQAIFAIAKAALPFDPIALCRGDDERIGLTAFTQPCILTMEIAVLECLGVHFGVHPTLFGGHSLGEYTALVAAGAIPFEVALRLVELRGRLMQAATPPGVGLMAALIMDELPHGEIRDVVARAGVEIANDNSPTQVVLSGLTGHVEEVLTHFADLERDGRMRIIRLATSAPFHSRHMRVIEDEFRASLEVASVDFIPARATAVTSNWTGGFHSGVRDDLIEGLVRQITGTVRWQDNMKLLTQAAPDAILEVGPDRTLRSFFMALGVTIAAVHDLRSAERALGAPQSRAA